MKRLAFEWDDGKNTLNKRKHRVSFEEALTVLADDHALLLPDPDHSTEEDRFILIGFSASLRMLVVCHCYRRSEEIIRIISARKATKLERADYTKRWKK
jgi:uncharacterized DUF497 family protein